MIASTLWAPFGGLEGEPEKGLGRPPADDVSLRRTAPKDAGSCIEHHVLDPFVGVTWFLSGAVRGLQGGWG